MKLPWPARVVPSLLVALLALSACSRDGGPQRVVKSFRKSVSADAPESIAVVIDSAAPGGGALCWSIMYTSAKLEVMEPVLLRVAVGAEVWITDAAGNTYQVEPPGRGFISKDGGFAGERATVELRGGKATAKLRVSPGETALIRLDGLVTVSPDK